MGALSPLLHVVQPDGSLAEYAPGSTILGLQEYHIHHFDVPGCDGVVLYVDDVELLPDRAGRFAWQPGFVAGQVTIVVAVHGEEFEFLARVDASHAKVPEEAFKQMSQEVLAYRAQLLLGEAGATRAFGTDASESGLAALARLTRLLAYGPACLKQIHALCSTPHRKLLPAQRPVPLSQVRRIPASALRHPGIAALASGHAGSAASAHRHIAAHTLTPTFDTAANRAIKALLTKMATQAAALLATARAFGLGAERGMQEQRLPRREARLIRLLDDISLILRKEPFRSVSRAETSAAGLTHIAAQPRYSRAYRTGSQSLWAGFGGAAGEEQLPVGPTWGVYEAWCFVHLMQRIEAAAGGARWRRARRAKANAEESYELPLNAGATLEIYFQASFPAKGAAPEPVAAWSISRKRIPDIVLAVQHGGAYDYVVLDAKFRRHRDNVLEAMESAHLYHDSLRIGALRPRWCVLLLPASSDVPHLDPANFVAEHGVGAISQFAPHGSGVEVCMARVLDWIKAATGQHQVPAIAEADVDVTVSELF